MSFGAVYSKHFQMLPIFVLPFARQTFVQQDFHITRQEKASLRRNLILIIKYSKFVETIEIYFDNKGPQVLGMCFRTSKTFLKWYAVT